MEHNYGRAFRIIRAAFGLRQSELAERMPVTASQLSLIESGKRQPSLRVVNGLANAVGVPVALISILAASPGEVESKSSEDVSALGGDAAEAAGRKADYSILRQDGYTRVPV